MWVLDALPGEVRAGEAERKDHPADLIETLVRIALPLRGRAALQEHLLQAGFSAHIARWTTTNLRPINGDPTCAPQLHVPAAPWPVAPRRHRCVTMCRMDICKGLSASS